MKGSEYANYSFNRYSNRDGLRIFTKPGLDGKLALDGKLLRWNGVDTLFCSPYDCFGYICSILGTAPIGASRENYFAPFLWFFSKGLVALAGGVKWAPNRAFISFKDVPFAEKPVMLCFDVPQEVHVPPSDLEVALGANIGGAPTMKAMVQEARWYWMKEQGGLDIVGSTPNQSILRDNTSRGQLFGHCAETIPLIVHLGSVFLSPRHVLKCQNCSCSASETLLTFYRTRNPLDAKNMGGMCMVVRSAVEVKNGDSNGLRDCLQDPCPNCEAILRHYQSDPEKFKAQMKDIIETFKGK